MTRSHLSIGEVLNLVQEEFPDVTISKIRFLESQGLLDPERTPSGYRKFYDDDIERLRWILRQQRENFLPLKVIKDRLAAGELDDPELDTPQLAVVTEVAEVVEVVELELLTFADAPEPEAEAEAQPEIEVEVEIEPEVGAAPVEPEVSTRPDPNLVVSALLEGPADRHGAIRTPGRTSPSAPVDVSSVSLSLEELCAAAGLTAREVADLERFGLLAARSLGPTSYYDDDALVVASLAARFMRHGVEPRHLRMYKMAAEREAAVVDQLALPLLQQRKPEARQQVAELVGELTSLGGQLRAALVDGAVRQYLA